MATVGKYNLAAVTLVMWGRVITGFGEDGAVEVTVPSDVTDSKVSADGQHVAYSKLNDPRVDVTITVMEGTRAARILDELDKAMDALDIIPVAPFMLFDPSSGDRLSGDRFVFMKRPGVSKGKTAGERQWAIQLPNGRANMHHAPLIP